MTGATETLHLVEESGIRELADEVAAADEPDVPIAGRSEDLEPELAPRRRCGAGCRRPRTTGSARELSTNAGLPV